MRVLKSLGILIAIAIGLFLFIANFSAVEARYECTGSLDDSMLPAEKKGYLKIDEYRWWVGLWSDSDGSVWFEVPGVWTAYYPHARSGGEYMQIFDSPGVLKGNFSKLSRNLTLALPGGVFRGECRPQSDA